MFILEPIYLARFHSSRILNWQLEEAVINDFEDIKKELGPIKNVPDVLKPSQYVEKWRVLLWDKAYIPLIRAGPPFTKGSKLRTFKFGSIAINRVLYR